MKIQPLKPMKPADWIRGAVAKHTWKGAYRIALQCQKTPNEYWFRIGELIKILAPPGALEETTAA